MLESQKDLFDLPDDVVWLNCAQHGPSLKKLHQAGLKGLDMKRKPWKIAQWHSEEDADRLRGLFAGLIGATLNDIALVPSVSYAISTAARNLSLAGGKRVLVLEEQFPSNVYPWWALAERDGGEVVTVPRPQSGSWAQAIERYLDDRVAIVALPNYHWIDGSHIDLAALAPKIHDLGAAFVLDLSQSIGVVCPDLSQLRPDYLVSVGYKWLLGPYRLTYFYVAPHRQEGNPLEEAWSSRKGSEKTQNLTNYTDSYLPGARRFDSGERGDFIAFSMAEAALSQVTLWGADKIAKSLKPLTERLAEGAKALGLQVTPSKLCAPHFMGITFPQSPPDGLRDRLAAQKIYVSLRGQSLRVSPYLYNDETDIETFLNKLAEML